MIEAAEVVDQAGPVRAGEELDLARVDRYLRKRIPGLAGPPEAGQFARGASNLTYLLRYPGRDLVLRRPPFGHKAKTAHDMLREARVMRLVRPAYPVVPEVLLVCDDPVVMGCDFFVMERIAGIIPRQDLPAGLGFDAATTRRLCESVIDKLVELHSIPLTPELLAIGKGEGYVQRQVEGWSRRFRDARTGDVSDFEAVMGWLAANRPAGEVAIRMIHGDFRFDNVVLDPADPLRVIGVLDWEMATLGPREMDVAWIIFAHMVFQELAGLAGMPGLPEVMREEDVRAQYQKLTGVELGDLKWFYVYSGVIWCCVFMRTGARRVHFGEMEKPEDVESLFYHASLLRRLIEEN